MTNKSNNYHYLLRLYSLVDEYLANTSAKQESLPEMVVSFCIVAEKILKIRLHEKNPVLIYENGKMKECDALIAVVKDCEVEIETIRFAETVKRYSMMFNEELSENEVQVLMDIYQIRNHFIHGYKSDDRILSDKENILKKMGTVWEKVSAQAISIFGKDLIKANKPRRKYSKDELEKILIEEVKKKIQSDKILLMDSFHSHNAYNPLAFHAIPYSSMLNIAVDEKCPRCGFYGFSVGQKEIYGYEILEPAFRSSLYKCSRCNLELTEKEFEIAKRLTVNDVNNY